MLNAKYHSFANDAPIGSDSEDEEPIVNGLFSDTDNADDETSETEYENLVYNVDAFINPVFDVDDLDLDGENTDDESINGEDDPFADNDRDQSDSDSQSESSDGYQEDQQELEEPNNTEESSNNRNENSNNGQPDPSINPGNEDHRSGPPRYSRNSTMPNQAHPETSEESNNAQPGISRNIEHPNSTFMSNNSMDPNNAERDTYNNPVSEDADYDNLGKFSSTTNQDSYSQQSVSRNSNNDKAKQGALSNSRNENSMNDNQDAPSNQISKVSILHKNYTTCHLKELVSGPREGCTNIALDTSSSFASCSNSCRSPQSVHDEDNACSQTHLPSNNNDQNNASNTTSPTLYGVYGTPGRANFETRESISNFPSGTYDDSPLPCVEVLRTFDDATVQLPIGRASLNSTYLPPHLQTLTNYSTSHNVYGLITALQRRDQLLSRNGMTRPSVQSLSYGSINIHRYHAPNSNNSNARTLPSSGYPDPEVSSSGALGAFGNLDSSSPGFAAPDLPWCVFYSPCNGNFSGSTALNNYNRGRHADQGTFQYPAPDFYSNRAQRHLIYFPAGSNGLLNYQEPFNFLMFLRHAIPARYLNLYGSGRNLSDCLIHISPTHTCPSNTNHVSGYELDSHMIFNIPGTPVTSYGRDQTMSRFIIPREQHIPSITLYPDAMLLDLLPNCVIELPLDVDFSDVQRWTQAFSSSGPSTHSESGTSVTSYGGDPTMTRFVISREQYIPAITQYPNAIPPDVGLSDEQRWGQASSSSGPTTQSESLNVPSPRARGRGRGRGSGRGRSRGRGHGRSRGRGRGRYFSRTHSRCNGRGHSRGQNHGNRHGGRLNYNLSHG